MAVNKKLPECTEITAAPAADDLVYLVDVDDTTDDPTGTSKRQKWLNTIKHLFGSRFAADAGSNDTYVATLTPAPAAYETGMDYRFKANTANTGACTVNFNGLGAKTIKKVAGGITTDLADNDIRAGQWVDLVYDGVNMQMQSLLGNAPSGGLSTEDVQDIVGAMIVGGTDIAATYDDGAGTLTIDNTGGGGGSGSANGVRTKRLMQAIPRARDQGINFPGFAAAPGVGGTVTQDNTADGVFHKRTTAATSGSVANWNMNSLDSIQRRWTPDLVIRFRTPSDITNVRFWIAISTGALSGSSATAGHTSAFRYATDVDGTAFWRTSTRDNSTTTENTTALAVAADTVYTFRIVESDSNVKFYYHDGSDWVELASHTTNLPLTTEDRWYFVSVTALEAVAKTISLSYVCIEHE